MNPGIEQDVRAFEPHLGRVSRRIVLNVDRCRDGGARNAESLRDMPLHLRAEDQLGLKLGDLFFNF